MTTIEWTNETWNPITGCTKISAGCKHCYAEGVAKRFWGDRKFSDVQFHPERLEQPLKWKKPRMVFVNSMSDLFHESVKFDDILKIFMVMREAKQHTFQVLTKRPDRMLTFMRDWYPHAEALANMSLKQMEPPSNVHLGVTVENQKAADERIPPLLQTPAFVRFLSCEPLLESVNIGSWLHLPPCPQHPNEMDAGWGHLPCDCRPYIEKHVADGKLGKIDWVIVGGESGHGARPCDIEWIRSIVQQCKTAKVPVFVKQLGSYPVENRVLCFSMPNQTDRLRTPERREKWIKDRKGGDINEFPEDLRIREFPVV
jgi:protein gp37